MTGKNRWMDPETTEMDEKTLPGKSFGKKKQKKDEVKKGKKGRNERKEREGKRSKEVDEKERGG